MRKKKDLVKNKICLKKDATVVATSHGETCEVVVVCNVAVAVPWAVECRGINIVAVDFNPAAVVVTICVEETPTT